MTFKLNTGRARGLLPNIECGDRIPKQFFNIYTGRRMPAEFVDNQSKLQWVNRSWQFRFFNGEDIEGFIHEEYGTTILDYYHSIGEMYGACRADLFRYLLMYRMGGIYLDLKSSASLPFSSMLRPHDRFLLAEWDRSHQVTQGRGRHPELRAARAPEFQQWHIIAAKGHPYLRNVIERVLHNVGSYVPEVHGRGVEELHLVTGPIAYSLAIAEMLQPGEHRRVCSNTDLGLIYNIHPHARGHQRVHGAHHAAPRPVITGPDDPRRLIGAGVRAARAAYHAVSRVRLPARLPIGQEQQPAV